MEEADAYLAGLPTEPLGSAAEPGARVQEEEVQGKGFPQEEGEDQEDPEEQDVYEQEEPEEEGEEKDFWANAGRTLADQSLPNKAVPAKAVPPVATRPVPTKAVPPVPTRPVPSKAVPAKAEPGTTPDRRPLVPTPARAVDQPPALHDENASRPAPGEITVSADALRSRARRIFTPKANGQLKVSKEIFQEWHKGRGSKERKNLELIFQQCGYDPDLL